jgi:hypothetical protein
MIVVVGVETLLLVLLTVLVFGLLRAYAGVLERLHALESGDSVRPRADDRTFSLTPVPRVQVVPLGDGLDPDEEFPAAHDIAGVGLDGETVLLRTIDVEHDTVLLFLSSGCSTCATFWDELRRPVLMPPRTRLLVVTQGAESESVVSLRKLSAPTVDVVLSSEAWEAYGVPGSPYVIAVNGLTGRVRGEGTGQSWTQIAELLARATGDSGYLTGGPSSAKPASDAERESDVDRELIEAGLLPGDPRLYGGS